MGVHNYPSRLVLTVQLFDLTYLTRGSRAENFEGTDNQALARAMSLIFGGGPADLCFSRQAGQGQRTIGYQ